MFNELYGYLKTYMVQYDWDEEHTKKQARSIFTTICLYCDINADTAPCDYMLYELYNMADIQELDVSYDEFENYMLEYIV